MRQPGRTLNIGIGWLAAMLAATLAIGLGLGYLLGRPPAPPKVPLNTADVPCIGVLDGDTIRVDWQGQALTVRMLGIDCPETRAGRKLVEQVRSFALTEKLVRDLGVQARNRTTQYVTNRVVRLVFPGSPEQRDAFGRLLAYVEVDGQDVGRVLLQSGFAVLYPADHPRIGEYREAMETARRQRRGVWQRGG
jgi:micrococcal nuclease